MHPVLAEQQQEMPGPEGDLFPLWTTPACDDNDPQDSNAPQWVDAG